MTTCPSCNGYGSISTNGGFANAGELPIDTPNCPECKGTGYVPPRFFVEFLFEYDLTGRTYWLPLLILADNPVKANKITSSTKKALGEHFENIQHSTPIPESNFTKPYIYDKFNLHKNQKLAIMNIDVWKFTDIEPNPEWSFDEHLKFIGEELLLTQRTIAERVEAKKFPVRVIREGRLHIDFKEFLLINVVKAITP